MLSHPGSHEQFAAHARVAVTGALTAAAKGAVLVQAACVRGCVQVVAWVTSLAAPGFAPAPAGDSCADGPLCSAVPVSLECTPAAAQSLAEHLETMLGALPCDREGVGACSSSSLSSSSAGESAGGSAGPVALVSVEPPALCATSSKGGAASGADSVLVAVRLSAAVPTAVRVAVLGAGGKLMAEAVQEVEEGEANVVR